MKVQVMIPCFIDQLFPQTAVHFIELLRKAGVEIYYPETQTCCGQPAYNAGYWDQAIPVMKKACHDFDQDLPIVCLSSSCTGFVRNYYPDALGASAQKISNQIYEFTEFLIEILHTTDFAARFPHKVVYHNSCSALRECKMGDKWKILLEQVADIEILDFQDSNQCCGFGGTFSVHFEPISVAMAEKKVNFALEAGAAYIISADLSCLMHMDAYIQNKSLPIQCIHIADVLVQS